MYIVLFEYTSCIYIYIYIYYTLASCGQRGHTVGTHGGEDALHLMAEPTRLSKHTRCTYFKFTLNFSANV